MNPEGRAKTLQDMPGPGQYDASYQVVRERSPKYTLGKRGKREYSSEVPGPGTYDATLFNTNVPY